MERNAHTNYCQLSTKATPLCRLENRHRLTLFIHYVTDCSRHMLRLPQPTCASMSRPPLATRSIHVQLIQLPARICLEIIHHPFRLAVGLHDYMNMVGSNVRCKQCPTMV